MYIDFIVNTERSIHFLSSVSVRLRTVDCPDPDKRHR